MNKRCNYINWDDYFMGVAILSAYRSKDPNTQVGACIVNQKNQIIATGYNGSVRNFSDNDINWKNDSQLTGTNKYSYLVDAEANAILSAIKNDLIGATIYITHYPCNNCLKLILQCGITKIFYISAKHPQHINNHASQLIIKGLNIKVKQLKFSTIVVSSPL